MSKRVALSVGCVVVVLALCVLATRPDSLLAGGRDLKYVETAVLAGTVWDGQEIPLPTYVDGTVASPADCQWTLAPNYLYTDYKVMLQARCYTDPGSRVAHIFTEMTDHAVVPGGANYMIVATRVVDEPVQVEGSSWGLIKSRFGR